MDQGDSVACSRWTSLNTKKSVFSIGVQGPKAMTTVFHRRTAGAKTANAIFGWEWWMVPVSSLFAGRTLTVTANGACDDQVVVVAGAYATGRESLDFTFGRQSIEYLSGVSKVNINISLSPCCVHGLGSYSHLLQSLCFMVHPLIT